MGSKHKGGKTDPQTQDDMMISSVYGFDTTQDSSKLSEVSTASFLLQVSSKTSSASGLKINVDCERTDVGDTLYDFITDIWTNSRYGMNEKLEYLEMRGQLKEKISLLLDTQETAYDQITNVLKSFGYLFYPFLTKFIIKKKEPQPYNKMIFTSKNTSKITFTYALKDRYEESRGLMGRYLKQGEIVYSNYYFPERMDKYEEVMLYGVSDEDTARKAIRELYFQSAKVVKTATIETSLIGIIPELNDRVGIATEYIDGNYVCEVTEISGNNIRINQSFDFKENENYFCQVINVKDGSQRYPIVKIVNPKKFINYFSIVESIGEVDISDGIVVMIGNKKEIVEPYIVKNIELSELSFSTEKPITATLSLQEYVE